LRSRLKRLLFRLLGKDPEAVVVSFATGPPDLVEAMWEEIQRLEPNRRHILIKPGEGSAFHLYKQLRPYRIGLAPVLFTNDPQFSALRLAALLLAPTKILAYNARMERHHLRLSTAIASYLFLRGAPLDRIWVRPRRLFPWKRDRSLYPTGVREFDGRPLRHGRARLGVLTPYFPYPLSHGGVVRIFHLIREMAREFDIILIAFGTDEPECDLAPLLELCAKIVLVDKPRYREPRWSTLRPPEVAEFDSPAMHRVLRRMKLDALQVEYTALAPYRGDILVEHDVTFELFRQVHQRERSLSSWWDAWRWRRFEKKWVARYRGVVVMSEHDRALLGKTTAAVIPNGVDLARFIPEPERPGARLLFIGSFRHFPNVIAFRFLLDQVWPLLSAARPDITLTIVAGDTPLVHWTAHTGLPAPHLDARIRLLDFVADVRPLYAEANLALVPTLVSAGTNLKVLEALAMERAVLSTTSGCNGLDLVHGETVWIADAPEDFAAAAVQLLADDSLRRRIAAAGRAYVQTRFDWRRIGLHYRRYLRAFVARSILLRPVTPADLADIAAIQATAPQASQWEPSDYLSYDTQVAIFEGALAGFLVSRSVAKGQREILNIVVRPDLRRRGVAAELIENELARWPGEHFLEVRESNQPARNLYAQLGFRESGVRPDYYDDPTEAAIVMSFFS
jgi:glycosyltransferase involved in cell wall biosynthesis